MDILAVLRLLFLVLAGGVSFVLLRRLPVNRISGIYFVVGGFVVILIAMVREVLISLPWTSEHITVPVNEVLGLVQILAQIIGLLFVLIGSYLAIRSLEPHISDHYSSLVERSLVGVYLVQDGLIQFVNFRLSEIFGYERSEMLGKPMLDFVAPESRDLVIENVRRRTSGESEAIQYELCGLTKDSKIIYVEVYGSFTTYRGRPAVQGTLLDVSWRKHSEQRLLQSHERHRSFVEQSVEGIWRCEFVSSLDSGLNESEQVDILLKSSRLVECNTVSARMYGFVSSDQLLGLSLAELMVRDHLTTEHLRKFIQSNYRLTDVELSIRQADGSDRIFLNNLIGFFEGTRVTHVWCIQRDITQLRMTQNALRRIVDDVVPKIGEEFFKAVVKHLAEALEVSFTFIGLISEDGKRIATRAVQINGQPGNNFTYDLRGSPCETVVGMATCFYTSGVAEIFKDDFLLKEMGIDSYMGTPLFNYLGKPIGLIVAMDTKSMTHTEFKKTLIEVFALRAAAEIERMNADEALGNSEKRFRGLFENALTANYVSTPDGRLVACNGSFARLYGFDSIEEAMAVRAEDVYPDRQQREDFVRLIRHKKMLEQYESTYVRKNGQEIHVVENAVGVFDDKGELVQIQGTLLDVTERKQMEEHLLQSQKIESLGILAGGIAHDFNNLLTVVNTNLFLAESVVDPGHPVLGPLNDIKTTVKRAVSLTAQILAFGRKQVMEREHHELDTIVHEFGVTLRRIIEEDIQITLSVSTGGAMVLCDRGQIEQIVLNLCVNARDAMEKGGTIGIRTYTMLIDQAFCRENTWARVGRFACLEVSDDGCGIEPPVLERIFDPFFTTKEVGKGSGMGLAVVYGIIKAHQGLLDVRSARGKGSVFSVYLPVVDKIREHIKDTESDSILVRRGTETILLVEDNNQIRDVTSMILTEHGYSVLTANNGEEALTIMGHADNRIDLVFTDMVMPKMGGRELYDRTRISKPEMKFLFTSGYTFVAQDMDFIGQRGAIFVQKPYQVETLLATIRKIIDRV